jgi:surface polysaccharide O-acyltransferase-like enzyme
VKREFDSLAFPKYIKFGFTSLVVYAALGVIFPLTYGIWGKYLLEDNVDLMFLIFHANDIALLLFVIGLSLTLVYIALELIHALESKDLVSKRKSVNEH